MSFVRCEVDTAVKHSNTDRRCLGVRVALNARLPSVYRTCDNITHFHRFDYIKFIYLLFHVCASLSVCAGVVEQH